MLMNCDWGQQAFDLVLNQRPIDAEKRLWGGRRREGGGAGQWLRRKVLAESRDSLSPVFFFSVFPRSFLLAARTLGKLGAHARLREARTVGLVRVTRSSVHGARGIFAQDSP